MKITFCGASREVTGSSFLLTLDNGFNILIDCGLYQGSDEMMLDMNSKWLFDPRSIDMVVLTHAHIDHTGKLPKLIRDGFKGEIYATHATRSLCAIMLLDSARIQERDAHSETKASARQGRVTVVKPLYTPDDVAKTMKQFVGMPYDKWLTIHPGFEILFRDAGHLLGSANVTFKFLEGGQEKWVGFTGDIGRPDRPIIRDPQQMPEVDYLVCESTYGDREHTSRPEEADALLKIIKQTCLERRGKVIIPAFSVGRTQEVVYTLDRLETAGLLPHIPVYVDSPLAVNATQVFGAHPECFDDAMNEYLLVDSNPFGFNALHYIRDVSHSKQINASKEPCIIISSSGMMNAGRVKHHLYHNIEDPNCTFLMVGYCAPETPGGRLLAGARNITVYGERKRVRARIERMDSFSAHADRSEMLDFLRNQQRLKRMFLVHGEYETQLAFRTFLEEHIQAPIEIPSLGQQYGW